MKNNFKESLSKIDIPAGRKDAILSDILSAADSIRRGKRKENNTMKNIWKFALAGVSLVACITLAVIAVPALNTQPKVTQNTVASVESPKASEAKPVIDTFELSAKSADSPQYITLAALKNGNKIEMQYILPDDFFAFDKNDTFIGGSAMDLMVENADAVKVIFESKNYDLDYEDSRNWVTDDNSPTWCICHFTIKLEDLGGKQEFSRDEVIAVLENIQTSSDQKYKLDMKQFVYDLYASELQAVINDGGDTEKFIEEKMSEPINFEKYLSDYGVINEEQYQFLHIILINPDNQPIRVIGKKVETRSGELVVWAPDGNKLVGKHRDEIDYTSITDEITVTVVYADGSSRKQVWIIEFNEDGKAILRCADVSGTAV